MDKIFSKTKLSIICLVLLPYDIRNTRETITNHPVLFTDENVNKTNCPFLIFSNKAYFLWEIWNASQRLNALVVSKKWERIK